jgi:hypothetical protein
MEVTMGGFSMVVMKVVEEMKGEMKVVEEMMTYLRSLVELNYN